jgi:hypothetical protein
MTDEDHPPRLPEPAPGLVWRKRHRKGEWVATWLARTDKIKAGYRPKHIELWSGAELDERMAADIIQRCQHQQFDMLTWGKELPPPEKPLPDHFTGNLTSLIHCYRTDSASPYAKNRYHVRQSRDSMLKRIAKRHGEVKISEIKARLLLTWHEDWSSGGLHLATASSFVRQLRACFSFGATLLEDPECERLCSVMTKMRFPGTTARGVSVTYEYATAIIKTAHDHFGWPSIGLGQALQFEGTLRQKDVIGEWVPLAEPGMSATIARDVKWLRGVVWQEIDDKLILRHITSKKQKLTEIDLKLAPMVLAEFQFIAGGEPLVVVDEITKKVTVNRGLLPASGPIVICDTTGLPWTGNEYRRKWRLVANKAGVPLNIWNMDSRSGAISEAIQAGVPIEFVRHAATHSDISQTSDYDRSQAEANAKSMKIRSESRNRPKTGDD